MGKTIAITPSWYWPPGVPRVFGVPPFRLDEFLVDRVARRRPDETVLADGGDRLTGRELAARVEGAAEALAGRVDPGRSAVFASGPSVEGVLLLLAILRAGVHVHMTGPDTGWTVPDLADGGVVLADGIGTEQLQAAGLEAIRLADLDADTVPEGRAGRGADDESVVFPGAWGPARHSHRSLLAGGLALGTFMGTGEQRPWVSTFSPSSWTGVAVMVAALAGEVPLVLAPSGEPALEAVAREGAGVKFTPLTDAFAATREHKREVKSVRGLLSAVVVPTSGLFDPDERRRVSRQYDCPALTLFGLPEVGPIFAAHASWYLDESIGIPVPNAHVVPVEPGSRRPLASLWELVESAMVTVWSPALAPEHPGERLPTGALVTGVTASSDPNGMIYVLPDS